MHIGKIFNQGFASRAAGLVVAIGLSIGFTTGYSDPAVSQTALLPVKIGYYASSASSVPIYVADAKALFAKNGLKADLVLLASGSAAGTALLADGIDIALLGIEEMGPMSARGEPVRAILGNWAIVGEAVMGRSDVSWPHAKDGYPAVMQDIKGKTIGITGPNSLTDYVIKSLLVGANYQTTDVNIVAIGGPGNALAAFAA